MKTAEEILIKAWVNLEDLPKTRAAMVKAMDEYSSLVSEEKDRRIRELEKAQKVIMFNAWCAARNYDFIENFNCAISELDRTEFEQWYNQEIVALNHPKP